MKKLIVLCLLICIPSLSFSKVEKWVDENGKTHYGSKAPVGSNARQVNIPVSRSLKSRQKVEKVVLYSTSWCGFCKKAKAYMKKNRIAFTEYDIEKDASAKRQYDAIGGKGIPFLVKDGKTQAGFTRQSYARFFAK